MRGVRGEAAAHRAYRARTSGYYVVNHHTEIAVAGPFDDHGSAQLEKAQRDNRWPTTGELETPCRRGP